MKKLSNKRGAISVFLIIIFVVTYVFAGLLVDAGRYRMAKAYAESAIDSAASSVLANYNQLVYDLYGLFCVDLNTSDSNELQTKVKTLFEQYINTNLEVAEINTKEYGTVLTEMLLGKKEEGNYLNAYHFTVDLKAGTGITLANTNFVEYQIVEHMKYRAPLSLIKIAEEDSGLLSCLNAMVSMKDRILAAKEKEDITKQHKDIFEECANLLEEINYYAKALMDYTLQPDKANFNNKSEVESQTGTKVRNVWSYIVEFDAPLITNGMAGRKAFQKEKTRHKEKMEKIGGKQNEIIKEINTYKTNSKKIYEEMRNNSECEELKETLERVENNAKELKNRADNLINEIENLYKKFEAYINQLEEKYKGHDTNENYKTVFLPAIELAKSNCGELLSNLELLLEAKFYADKIAYSPYWRCSLAIYNVACDLLKDYIFDDEKDYIFHDNDAENIDSKDTENTDNEEEEDLPTLSLTLYHEFPNEEKTIPSKPDFHQIESIPESLENLSDLQDYLYVLNSYANYFIENRLQGVKIEDKSYDSNAKEANDAEKDKLKEKEKETSMTPVGDLNEEALKIDYEAGGDGGQEIVTGLDEDREWSFENLGEALNLALNLISQIERLLENLRDNLYVNEYIMNSFPNYVEHYLPIQKNEDTKKITLLSGGHEKYNASFAEVEYILTGIAKGTDRVNAMRMKLFGTRMMFNLAAIITDSAKISQAQMMAAFAGPFALPVSILLLVAWATAESVLDVLQLMEGSKDIPIFKQGKNWKISLEGAIDTVVGKVVDIAVDTISEKINGYLDSLQKKSNEIIYDVYQKADQAVNTKLDELKEYAQKEIQDWNKTLADSIGNSPEGGEQVKQIAENIGKVQNSIFEQTKDTTTKVTSNIKEQAVLLTTKLTQKAKEKSEKFLKNQSENAKKFFTKEISSILPKGEVVNTGSSAYELKMSYTDYLNFYLLFMDKTEKLQRVQSLIQANLIAGGQSNFRMKTATGAVWADLNCSIDFFFLSNGVVPDAWKKKGKMNFKVMSAQTY